MERKKNEEKQNHYFKHHLYSTGIEQKIDVLLQEVVCVKVRLSHQLLANKAILTKGH